MFNQPKKLKELKKEGPHYKNEIAIHKDRIPLRTDATFREVLERLSSTSWILLKNVNYKRNFNKRYSHK